MFKRWFGKDKKPTRKLSHPKQLLVDDIIVFDDSFSLPATIRGQQYQVNQVNSYEFENEKYAEYSLQGISDESLHLTVQEDDESYLTLSRKLNRQEIEASFNTDELSAVFEEGNGTTLNVQVDQLDTDMQPWLDNLYREEIDAVRGFFYAKLDCRSVDLMQHQRQSQEFEYYCLENDGEDKLIEIEVWSDGSTDIMTTLVLPLATIKELWPGESVEGHRL